MASLLGPGLSMLSHQDILEAASRLVDKHLQEDRNYPDLSDLLRIPNHGQPSQSGLQDFDYPSLMEAGVGLETLSELALVKRAPIPPELVEQFGRMQCNCMMGIFPEIQRAWLIIDSDIFVWRFEDGGDLAYFDGLSETILSAALVVPKPGIFRPHIQYLLCLATPLDIVLLGVSFARPYEGSMTILDSDQGEMHLLPDPLFSIPTDNTYILNVAGTKEGRIFMAGKDGCLYELMYQAEDSWFSRKCRKINHSTSTFSFLVPSFLNFSFSQDDPLVQISIDDSRHTLYTRSEKGTIQVFDLGADGKGMRRVAAMTQHTIMQTAQQVARTVEGSNFKTLVHIAALNKAESSNLHLVAVTQSGVRLYFTTNPFGGGWDRPGMFTLMHVRLPPGFSANAMVTKPSSIHTAYHRKGVLLLLGAQNENNDMLWSVSCDSFPFQNQLMESQSMIPVSGKTWAVEEVTKHLRSIEPADPTSSGRSDPPAVVTQHIHPSRRFAVLTAQGCHVLQKLRPVEQLHQLLLDCSGPEAEEVKTFFRLHKVDQACATCLILACSRAPADAQVCEWAKMAFFLYGGDAKYNFSVTSMPGLYGTPGHGVPGTPGSMMYPGLSPHAGSMSDTAVPLPGLLPMHMSTPKVGYGSHSFHQPGSGGVGSVQEVIYSGKHNGICIYLGRILRPFWDSAVTKQVTMETPEGLVNFLTSAFSAEELTTTLEMVRDLSDFVDYNARFDTSTPTENGSMVYLPPRLLAGQGPLDDQTKKKLQAEAQRLERISLQHLQELLHRVEECLGLWRILVDHQFHVVTSLITEDQQRQLHAMSFKQLMISGKEICGALISGLINRYLDDNATIDAISVRLREVCPSLYSADDAICSKANELLQAARVNANQMERRQQLLEALKLFKEVSQPLRLSEVCAQFAAVNFYEGVVDLCLAEAQKADPHGLALHFYRSGEPPEDAQGLQAFITRMDCYKCVTETLGSLWTAATSHPQAPSIPKVPGPPQAPDTSRLDPAHAASFGDLIIELALKSDDALFHTALYNYLLAKDRGQLLLEIDSPFVEPYLKRKSEGLGGTVKVLDMLWQYYEKSQNFQAAARILSHLAERHGIDVNLSQRIEYLSRAIMCAKSCTSTMTSGATGEFLQKLEEKMEVARLQLQVAKALTRSRIAHLDAQEALDRLNADLMDISMLYGEFADRFDLYECRLAIIHCGGVCDPGMVEKLWENIVDQEMSAVNLDSQGSVATVSDRIAAIARIYVNAERYFPLAFVVRHMEQRSCEQHCEPVDWVVRTMLTIKIAPGKLLQIYDHMLKSRDPFWHTVRRPLHLMSVLHALMSLVVDNPSLLPASDRRRFATQSLDTVSSYLVELQAMSSTDQQVSALMRKFRSLQARLERF